jgi:hypothetical protein
MMPFVGGGGGAGSKFGMMPALAEPVRSRTNRQTPRVLRITFPFEVMGANQTRRRILLRYGGFVALDRKWASAKRGVLT